MADYRKVTVARDGGSVSVRVRDETHPQVVTGVVWKWDPQKAPQGRAGDFSTSSPTVTLGKPDEIDGFYFGTVGGVLVAGMPDDPPTPYEVTVTVLQGGVEVDAVVPDDGGRGELGEDDKPFTHYFVVEVAP